MGTILHEEHELLGATFVEVDEELMAAESYVGEVSLDVQLRGCVLADLSPYTYRYVSGPDSRRMLSALTCAPELSVGECGFCPMLAGDASLVSVPLVLVTGDTEYALLDPSPRGVVAEAWLSFVEGIKQGDEVVFEEVDDLAAHTMLVPLMIAGQKADYVLSDYLMASQRPPLPGRVESLLLDRMPMIVAGIPWSLDVPGYLILVPAQVARVMWRSLLSFLAVGPLGQRGLYELLAKLPFGKELCDTEKLPMDVKTLERWGLLREDRTFIGARGL